jgi:decaprenylphospho-beta-D-ribofuranose 2-oxidase
MCRIIFIFLLISTSAYGEYWTDISRINKENVSKILLVKSDSDVIDAIKYASQHHKKIVISGTRHSQGGHILFPEAVLLNMTSYNKILNFDIKNKRIVVQSGATWNDIQKKINPHGLSVKIMQSANIFSVGGSISANVHGRDPNYGPLLETIKSIKVALSTGEIITASQHEKTDLFYAITGGYGLLGVILEAEIELTDNIELIKTTTPIDVSEYIPLLKKNIDQLNLHYGRCSIVRDDSFLKTCYSIDYRASRKSENMKPITTPLIDDGSNFYYSTAFNLSRNSSFGKKIRWILQKNLVDKPNKKEVITRNNAMRPPIKFLNYHSNDDTDILQEYFIPLNNFEKFMASLRNMVISNDINLLNVTLRYLRGNNKTYLPYSKEDTIAVVLYINIGLNTEAINQARNWTRNLVNMAIFHHGNYYLTYQRFPTVDQFKRSYPKWSDFIQVKNKYDPNKLFYNKFYEQYMDANL